MLRQPGRNQTRVFDLGGGYVTRGLPYIYFFCVDIYHVYSKQRLAISCRNSRVRIRVSD